MTFNNNRKQIKSYDSIEQFRFCLKILHDNIRRCIIPHLPTALCANFSRMSRRLSLLPRNSPSNRQDNFWIAFAIGSHFQIHPIFLNCNAHHSLYTKYKLQFFQGTVTCWHYCKVTVENLSPSMKSSGAVSLWFTLIMMLFLDIRQCFDPDISEGINLVETRIFCVNLSY